MQLLFLRHLNTSSLLCDCQLKWLPQWMSENNFQNFVNASCAHPQLLKGKSIFAVSLDAFVCGEYSLYSSLRRKEFADWIDFGCGFFDMF